jgi:Matrixin
MILRRALAGLLAAWIAWAPAPPAEAYLKIGTGSGGQTVGLSWKQSPVRYFVTDAGVDGVSATDFRDAVGHAFRAWQDVSSARVSVEFASFTEAPPLDEDNTNTLGFLAHPDMERTLAATNYVVDTRSGEILEADIFFNSSFPWSVSSGGGQGRYDLQSIATHETGHFFGLGHSALGETEVEPGGGRRLIAAGSVMFPIAFSAGDTTFRTLRPDDIAGISDIYPASGFRSATGSIQGTVTKSGQGLFGAHVIAMNLRTGAMVAGFSLQSGGGFVIAGLAPGTYVVRVEPLDDGEVSSFFNDVTVDTDFRVTYCQQLVTVSAGAASASISVAVAAK